MPDLKVRVLKRNIAKGIQHDPKRCPIACRLKEMGFADVTVFVAHMILAAGGSKQDVSPPTTARLFIKRFDEGKPVKPFSFSLLGVSEDMLKAAKAGKSRIDKAKKLCARIWKKQSKQPNSEG